MEKFTYGQVERALGRLHDIDPAAVSGALRGRIKHLQRLGVPIGYTAGRGRQAVYGLEQIYQWVFCLELAEFGMDPSTIVEILKKRWRPKLDKEDGILRNLEAAASEKRLPEQNDLYLCVAPSIMSRSMMSAPPLRPDMHFRWFKETQADLFLRNVFGMQRRAAVINISDLMRRLKQELAGAEGV